MKSFFASVECAERGLNPFETNLVVADESRGKNALCLAITPKMKALGVKNRCRMSDIPKHIKYIVAMPRMKKYIEYNGDIYEIYRKYIDRDDIHTYSIDEAFIDCTDYLPIHNKTPKEFAKFLIDEEMRIISKIDELKKINNLATNNLSIGQKINLPKNKESTT